LVAGTEKLLGRGAVQAHGTARVGADLRERNAPLGSPVLSSLWEIEELGVDLDYDRLRIGLALVPEGKNGLDPVERDVFGSLGVAEAVDETRP
jgi:hypothetical protein